MNSGSHPEFEPSLPVGETEPSEEFEIDDGPVGELEVERQAYIFDLESKGYRPERISQLTARKFGRRIVGLAAQGFTVEHLLTPEAETGERQGMDPGLTKWAQSVQDQLIEDGDDDGRARDWRERQFKD